MYKRFIDRIKHALNCLLGMGAFNLNASVMVDILILVCCYELFCLWLAFFDITDTPKRIAALFFRRHAVF